MDVYCRNLRKIYESKAIECIDRGQKIASESIIKQKWKDWYYFQKISTKSYSATSLITIPYKRSYKRISSCQINSQIKSNKSRKTEICPRKQRPLSSQLKDFNTTKFA